MLSQCIIKRIPLSTYVLHTIELYDPGTVSLDLNNLKWLNITHKYAVALLLLLLSN